MNYYDRNNDTGFTLVELLIAMTIGLIILTALSSTFLMQRKIYDIQEQIAEMVQNARAAMDMMTREIRMAGYDPTDAGFDGITYDAHQLQIQANINGDEDIINADGSYDENENITYTYYDKNSVYPYQIKRKTGSGDFVSFALNIQSFTFVYLKADGVTEITTSAENDDIRQIKITITARTAKPDPDYSANGGYRTYTLTSYITPRNLAF
ncbi:MAG: prepilin-type N-terminal cleavage/methylation domain-containing protein [Thermodesulfobacteriota bacterium]|nr:prepilin-type N-terminal cleavage/methylation domain-containing protein [Thermodesulfobacteriota bacterium]